MSVFYLTEDLKREFMEELKELRDVDKEIRPYLDKINEVPFICTTQSCWGHPDDGYLSVMVTVPYDSWMEYVVLADLAVAGIDGVKKYENIGPGQALVRYIFMFDDWDRLTFLNKFITAIHGAKAGEEMRRAIKEG